MEHLFQTSYHQYSLNTHSFEQKGEKADELKKNQ